MILENVVVVLDFDPIPFGEAEAIVAAECFQGDDVGSAAGQNWEYGGTILAGPGESGRLSAEAAVSVQSSCMNFDTVELVFRSTVVRIGRDDARVGAGG